MTIMYTSLFRGSGAEPVEATEHFALAIRHVNNSLSSRSVPSDSTVMVIVSLLVHANLTLSLEQARVHLDGLQLILSLRPGGLEALHTRHPMLTQKICRADIEVALVHGTATRFGRESSIFSLEMLPFTAGGVPKLPDPLLNLCPLLQRLTICLLAVCRLCEAGVKLRPSTFQEIYISAMQQLLDFAPLRGPRLSDPDHMWQLGLLCFVTTGLYSSGMPLQSIYGGLLVKLLRGALEATEHARVGNEMSILRLWLLVMYGVRALTEDERSWIATHIIRLAENLELNSWEEARRALRDYPWIGMIHDGLGRELWETVSPAG